MVNWEAYGWALVKDYIHLVSSPQIHLFWESNEMFEL